MASKETEEKISKLQLMEQNLQTFQLQRQNFQAQQMEIESALEELEKSDAAYRIIGNIMVKTDKQALQQNLKQKKEQLELRIKALEKQEEKIKEKASKTQEEVLKEMKA